MRQTLLLVVTSVLAAATTGAKLEGQGPPSTPINPPAGLRSYAVHGCANPAVLSVDPRNPFGPPILGTPVCAEGFAYVNAYRIIGPYPESPGVYTYDVRLDALLSFTFNPSFAAAQISGDFGYVDYLWPCAGSESRCPASATVFAPAVQNPQVAPYSFQVGLYTPLVRSPSFGPGAYDVDFGRLNFRYALPNGSSVGPFNLGITLTFTATPEPTTLALTAAALATTSVAARRRRRVAS